jgi:hypothetical protein
MIDLAGAERPDKTGAGRTNVYDVMVKAMAGKDMDVADQGWSINFELSELLTCVSSANEAHKAGR